MYMASGEFYRKDNNHSTFTLHNYRKIEANLEALESFMDHDILYLGSRYKSRGGARPVHGGRSRSLNA